MQAATKANPVLLLQCVCVSPGQGFGAGADSFPPAGRRRRCVAMTSLMGLQVQLTTQFKETIIYSAFYCNESRLYTETSEVSMTWCLTASLIQ